MSKLATNAVAAAMTVLAAVGLAGCSEDDGTGGSAQHGAPSTTATDKTSADPASTPSSDEEVATEVSISRSGGIAGGQTSYTFTAGEAPPEGFTAAQRDRVLEVASAPALRDLEPEPLPKDLCCDLFVYEITVTWDDGTTRTFTTADGVETHPALSALMRAAG